MYPGKNNSLCLWKVNAFCRVMSWILDSLTTLAHNSRLHLITALLIISTLYKSPQHPLSLFPACFVFNSHSLAVASNSGNSSASHTHVITVQQISHNRTLVNCPYNNSAISSQLSLQSLTQLTTEN
jgi:hypothetical protein